MLTVGRAFVLATATGLPRSRCHRTWLLRAFLAPLSLLLSTSLGALTVAAATDAGLPEIAGPVDAGYRDFSFGSATLATPTGEKPQSKLWWNDGLWWGCLWDPAVGAHRIHRFDPVAHTWTSVGPNADNRLDTLVDVLWDGTRLYVVSHEFDRSGEFRLHSYTYSAATDTYTLRSGFPVVMGSGSAEALTIAKDTTGKLWITWEQSGDIMVNRSTSSETTWGSAFRLPVEGNDTASDDISGVLAFGNQVGIMWSNQNDKKMYFALHLDGDADTAWQAREEALANAVLGKVADDHLNMALTSSTNPPTLFAVTKTSLSGANTLPQIYLLRRDPAGIWTSYVAGDQDDDHTRAIVQIDDENRKIYVIARSNAGDNAIRIKVSDLDDIAFADGPGTAFIQSLANPEINNASGTKQTLNGTTDLLVIASDEVSRYYFHNTIDLPTSTPTPDIAVSPTTHEFGDIVVGSSGSQTFVVRNNGNASLQVTATSLTGTDPTQFVITSGGGAFALAPGATRDIVVTFGPTNTGLKNAALRFTSDDPDENPLDVALTGSGVLPDIAVNPTSLDYGNVLVGANALQTFTIENTGNAALQVTSTALIGIDAALFSITSGGGSFSVAPGDSHTVNVAFQPTSTGIKNATLQITSDDPDENPVDVVLSGMGSQPAIAVSPNGHDFGSMPLGTSPSQPFTIRNSGSGALHVAPPILIGPDSTSFAITAGADSFVVAPGDSHLVEVTFAATSVGTKNAALRLRSSDPDASILDLTLAGTAIQQDIAVAPAAHDYGAVSIGASDSLTIVVRNDGTDTLRVDAPSLTGPDPSDYVITAGGAAFVLAPADSHAITVMFAPATLGPKSATLLIASNDPDESLVEIPLSGIGTLAEIAASPAAHDYGDVLVGVTATHSFVVRNEGTGALALTVAGLTGIDARAFAITLGAGTFAVAPGDSHRVDISFTPETPGPRVAALRLTSNDPDEGSLDLALTGNGIAPEIAVHPGDYDFGAVLISDSTSYAFMVRNLGSAILGVTLTTLLGTDAGDFAIMDGAGAFSIAPGDSHQILVRFAPQTIGAKSAALRLASDDTDENPLDVALVGSGVQPDITVQPSLVFPTVVVGDSVAHQIVVRNEGSAPLLVTAAWVTGPDSTDFAITSAIPFGLAPGDSLAVGLRFAPLTAGSKQATLQIESDDPDENPALVVLAGDAVQGLAPDLDAPTAHVFGPVALWAADSLALDLGNTGTADLHVLSSVVLGPDSLDFALVTSGPFDIAPNTTGSLVVAFSPLALGTRHATLRIVSDDPDESPWDIALQGTGGAADLVVTPAGHAFGNVGVGTSALQSFQLTNQGLLPLHVSSTTFSGMSASEFAITSGGGAFELLPGASRNVVVAFMPVTTGAKGAALIITSNDPDTPSKSIALSGSGMATPAGTSPPLFVESASGSTTNVLTVATTDSLSAVNGQLYVAAISTRVLVDVTAVEGMGLSWSPVLTQCGANQTTGIAVWVGQGNPVPGPVTATFGTVPASAAIVVSRYAGVDLVLPVAASASANTAGISGACTGGTDSAGYSFPFENSRETSVVVTAVATGAGVLTPGTSWTQRGATQTGPSGAECGVALLEHPAGSIGSVSVDGTFDVPVDWAVVTLEIRAVDATTDAISEPIAGVVDRASLRVRGESGGRAPQIEIALPDAAVVCVSLHDVRGRRLQTLWQGVLPAGRHDLDWTGDHRAPGLAAGLYFVRADLGKHVLSRKILLVH